MLPQNIAQYRLMRSYYVGHAAAARRHKEPGLLMHCRKKLTDLRRRFNLLREAVK